MTSCDWRMRVSSSRRLSARPSLTDGSGVTGARVLIVDSQPLVGDAIATRLSDEHGIHVLTRVSTIPQAITATQMLHPDVVVVGTLTKEMAACDVTRMLREAQSTIRVVVLGDRDDAQALCDCLDEGAYAWLSNDVEVATLLQAIRDAMSDEIYIPSRLLTAVIRELQSRRFDRDQNRERLAQLSERERLVLDCMVSGLDRDAIARRLGVSYNTVRTHTQNCYAKLGVHSSLEAVHVAFRSGLRPRVLESGSRGDTRLARLATSNG